MVTGVVLALGAGANPAAAQTSASATAGRALAINASVSGGYDKNTSVDVAGGGPIDPRLAGGASNIGGDAGVSFSTGGTRVRFGATGGSSFRLHKATDVFTSHGHGAGAGLSIDLTRRMSLRASTNASYSPRYQFSVFPTLGNPVLGQAVVPIIDYSLASQRMLTYQFGSELTYRPTTRSSFGLRYGMGFTDFGGRSVRDGQSRDVGGYYDRGVTRYVSLRLGYTYREARYPMLGGGPRQVVRGHNIDAGVNYARALSFSRRTTFAFGTGTTAVDNGQTTVFRVDGRATLNHELSRTWSLGLAYHRGLSFIDGFVDPVFADSVTAGAGGGLGGPFGLRGSVSYSMGNIGSGVAGGDYQSYGGSLQLNASLGRGTSLFADYLRYHHTFAGGIALPFGTPQALGRHGVRGGLSLSLPLLERRSRAAG